MQVELTEEQIRCVVRAAEMAFLCFPDDIIEAGIATHTLNGIYLLKQAVGDEYDLHLQMAERKNP